MDKGLQEVINKLKLKQQNSQQISKQPEKAPILPPKQQEQEEEVSEDEQDSDFYNDEEEQKQQPAPQQKQNENKAPMSNVEIEMELLQNNGRFRAEMLYQLQEINRALGVIAQVLMQNK